jgi:hypothetical protein
MGKISDELMGVCKNPENPVQSSSFSRNFSEPEDRSTVASSRTEAERRKGVRVRSTSWEGDHCGPPAVVPARLGKVPWTGLLNQFARAGLR